MWQKMLSYDWVVKAIMYAILPLAWYCAIEDVLKDIPRGLKESFRWEMNKWRKHKKDLGL